MKDESYSRCGQCFLKFRRMSGNLENSCRACELVAGRMFSLAKVSRIGRLKFRIRGRLFRTKVWRDFFTLGGGC